MEQEQLMGILSEMLEEQKENANFQVDLKENLHELKDKMLKMEENLAIEKPDKISPFLYSSHQVMVRQLNEIKESINDLSRPVVHERRILFFPEHQSKDYLYSMFGIIALGIIVTLCFILLRHSITSLWN